MSVSVSPAPVKQLTIDGRQVCIFERPQDLFAAGAELFFSVVKAALAEQPQCSITLAGGSTPKNLYSLIADRVSRERTLQAIEWSRVHLFFGDERCVPPDHPDSNYRMVLQTLLAHGLVPMRNVHRVLGEKPPQEAAELYEEELRGHFTGPPRFDLLLLGLGPDGHTASLFPETSALEVRDRYVVANFVPKLKTDRITFSFPALNTAQRVLFMVSGTDKQQAVRSILVEGQPLPAREVRPKGDLIWFLDQASAALLGS